MARAIAFFFGSFSLLAGSENLWWIDVRPLPGWAVAAPGAILLAYALCPRTWRRAAAVTAVLLAAWAVRDGIRFYLQPIETSVPVPFSFLVAGLLLAIAWAPRTRWQVGAATLVALVAGFPVAHVFFFGTTSYAGPADAIVVFGARAYADGKPSQSLEDRVRTGVRLYHEGRAPLLFFSGGPGDGAIHETESMRALARELGVPADAILLDRDGLNTTATVRNSPPGRLLAVSHFYHLPRIKLAYRRADRDVRTVPAEEAYTVSQTPFLVAREIPAFWLYFARTCLQIRPT